jgi:hypothetical protein
MELSYIDFNKICSTVDGIHGEGLAFVNQAVLLISIIEIRNFPTTFDERLPYRISTKSVKLFMGYMDRSIYDPR